MAVQQIRLDRAFERADTKNVRGDLEPIEQRGKILLVAARPADECSAHRVNPHFAGMRGKQQAVVGIAHGKCEYRLLRRADHIQRCADFLHVHQTAAGKPRQIKRHSLDPIILCSKPQRADDIAGTVFRCWRCRGEQPLNGIDDRGFFNHRTIEPHQQGSVGDAGSTGPRGESGVKQHEEAKQDQEHQAVLDRDQQMPNLARENHAEPSIACKSDM